MPGFWRSVYYQLGWEYNSYNDIPKEKDVKLKQVCMRQISLSKVKLNHVAWELIDGAVQEFPEIPGCMRNNGLNLQDGWVEFVRLNPVFMEIPIPANAASVIFSGEWEKFEHWQLGERYRLISLEKERAIEEKELIIENMLISNVYN